VAILINNLIAGYGSSTVIRNFSFEATESRLYVVLGKNGSGKSTFFRCLENGMEYSGSILINGKDLKTCQATERATLISLVSQVTPNGLGISCLQVVMAGSFATLKPFERFSNQHAENAIKAMIACGCEAFAHRSIDELSGGERQLVWLAQAENQNTPFILLDEPGQYLDWRQKKILKNKISLWLQAGKTIFIASHDLEYIPVQDGSILHFSGNEVSVYPLNEPNLNLVKDAIEQGD